VPVEVRLVVESAAGGDGAEGSSGMDEAAGGVDAAGDQVLVWGHAECSAERADQVGRVEVQGGGCGGQWQSVDDVFFEQVAQGVCGGAAVRLPTGGFAEVGA
jgi:hypothetical protein